MDHRLGSASDLVTTDVHYVAHLGSDLAPPTTSLLRSLEGGAVRFRWWMPSLAVVAMSAGVFFYSATSDAGAGWFEVRSAGWWVFTTALHLPLFVALFFLLGGLVERLGFYWRGRAPESAGQLSQLGWAVLFAANGFVLCTIGAVYVASCVVYLGFFYGDHLGKVLFAFDRRRLGFPAAAKSQ